MLAWSTQDDSGLSDPSFSPELRTPGSPYPPFETSYPKPPSRTSSDYVGMGRLGDALPKKRTDALAEAWGVAEPEPFEEFFAGGGSERASAASSVRVGTEVRRGRDGKSDTDNERSRFTSRRGAQRAPPPKPIAVPGGKVEHYNAEDQLSAEPESPGTKRSRSLIQRIRNMRENPNIPVTSQIDTYDSTASVTGVKSSRPNHRSNNSFLGRFGRSPITPSFETQPTSPFSDKSAVANDDGSKEKQLPKLPGAKLVSAGIASGEGYFDQRGDSGDTAPGTAVSRRASLMRKVVSGVRRNTRT